MVYTGKHVVQAFKKGELTRHQVVMNRNMARESRLSRASSLLQ